MAYTSRELRVSGDRAFAVVSDPTTYPQWLIGAHRVHDVDATWPRRGSCFHHVVGAGPLRIADRTEVLEMQPGSVLSMRVRARPFIAAIVTFRVVAGDGSCVVAMQEEPALRTIGNIVRPVMDPLIHMRNHRSLRRLALLVEGGERSI